MQSLASASPLAASFSWVSNSLVRVSRTKLVRSLPGVWRKKECVRVMAFAQGFSRIRLARRVVNFSS